MTLKQIMAKNGNETQTSIWNDFSIADQLGISVIEDIYNRSFNGWKNKGKELNYYYRITD